MVHQPNEFMLWLKSQSWASTLKLKYEVVAQLAGGHGRAASAGYIRLIACGHKRPSYDLAIVLSKVTAGAVTVDQLMKFRRVDAAEKGKAA